MRLLFVLVVAGGLLGCDIEGDFRTYCETTGNCQCDGTTCCSSDVCGDGSLGCCAGTSCQQGHCTLDNVSLNFSEPKIDFGRFPDVTPTPTVSVLLTNSGALAGRSFINLLAVSGDASEFGVDASACPANLEPGASCTVQIHLAPKTLGLKQATLSTDGKGAPATVTGIFGWSVQVTFSSTQVTAVESSPPGLVCSSSGCAGYFAGGTALSLSVALPYGVTWGAPCPTTTGVCTLTVSADTQVFATIQAPLVVDVFTPGIPSGYVQIDPGAIACSGHCEIDISGAVTLTALAQNLSGEVTATVFQGWTGACAASGPVCALNVTAPIQTGVTLSDLNVAFLTGPVPLSVLGPDGAGADALCNADREVPDGGYRAWVATSTRNPAQLLATSAGWSPPQNPNFAFAPTALTVSELTSARLWTPISCPGCGTGGGVPNIITGANPDGSALSPADNCLDWTSSTGSAPVGSAGFMGYGWSVDLGAARIPCSGSAFIACFGTDVSGVALPVSPVVFFEGEGFGLMFLSSPWIPANGTAGGDSHCQADAVAAGLQGTFVAGSLEGSQNGGHAGAFNNFVRTDGAHVELGGYVTPNNVDALGNGVIPSVLSDTYVWVMAPSVNCNDWTGGPGAFGTVTRFDSSLAITLSPVSCSESHRLYCFQSQ